MSLPSLPINDNHRNSLLAGVKYIDGLLAGALSGLAGAVEDGAIFATTVPDATPVQRKVIAAHVVHLRAALRDLLAASAIPIRPPTLGGLWNLRSALIAIDITIEELGPSTLAGYGELTPEAAAGLSALQAQIRTRLAELRAYLDAGLGGDLGTRLARLDATRDEVRLLRKLESVVTTHNLVEFRRPLAHLLERLERNLWTVAFVGRVSCGKSSLLNHLLGTDVLPSGVTPVTAVPIRIVPGREAAVTVSFASSKPERLPVAELATFASEASNPGNTRNVADILLELPAPRLAGDVCFVDTPGLGSLATAGAAQTLAFLPRCDLGVLLLDGAGTLTDDDLSVARALLEGGAELLVVISKADLLSATDRPKSLGYVAQKLSEVLGRTPPLALVSVVPAGAALTEEWWTAELAPRLARHREMAAAVLRRKIGALREEVVAALERRDGHAATPIAADAHAEFAATRAALEATDRRAYDFVFAEAPDTEAVLDGVAAALAASAPGADLAAVFAGELGRVAADFGAKFEALLRDAHARVEQALANENGSSASVALAPPAARPLFDPASVLQAGTLDGGWRNWPVAAVRRGALRAHLKKNFAGAVESALRAYGHALARWSHLYLGELTERFNAAAGLIEARAAPVPEVSDGESRTQLAADLEELRRWNERPAA